MCEQGAKKRTDGELLAGVFGVIAGAATLGADAMLMAEMPPLVKGELRGWLADAAVKFGLAATSPAALGEVVLTDEWRWVLEMFLGGGEVGGEEWGSGGG